MAYVLKQNGPIRARELSVVIPWYNRCQSVVRLLRGLGNQTADVDSFEVVLVLDGCADSSAAAARDLEVPYALRIVQQPGRGRAAARNHGIRKSRGRIISCSTMTWIPDPGLVAAHLAAHRQSPGEGVLGRCPMLAEQNSTPERERIRGWWDQQFAKRSDPGHRFTFHDFITGNASLSRDLLLLDGFDETMPRISAGEDWELGHRLLKAGIRFRDYPQAWCIHRSSTEDILFRAREEGCGQALMVMKHPEVFFDFPVSRACGVFQRPALWQMIRLLWRHPIIVNAAGTLLNRLCRLAARLHLGRAQALLSRTPAVTNTGAERGGLPISGPLARSPSASGSSEGLVQRKERWE
jgi:GT2 family glycosyltransferase